MNKLQFTPYQYSIIRYYHDITTDEFLNIGVSVFSPINNYFRTEITSKYQRLTRTFSGADGKEYFQYVNMLMRRFYRVSEQITDKQQLEMFKKTPDNIEELLRLYLRKESSFRYSPPTSGIAPNSLEGLNETFDRLFYTYVNKYIPLEESTSRNDKEIWDTVYRPEIVNIKEDLVKKLEPVGVKTPQDILQYDYSWQNGKLNLIEPISFDMVSVGNVTNKTQRYYGKNVLLSNNDNISHLYLLLGKPIDKGEAILKKYNSAKDILMSNHIEYKFERKLIEEDGAKDFASFLNQEIGNLK